MTREPQDPDLTPEQEEEVRRLLVDARHTAPIPEDVASRLDRVLAELSSGEHPAPVASLASHRRRRAARMLVAAAAVVAVGVGLGQVVGSGGGSDSGSNAASSADSARDVPSAARKATTPPGESALAGSGSVDAYALPTPVRVREQHFSSDVRAARQLLRKTLRAAQVDSASNAPNLDSAGGVAPCPRGDWGVGRLVAARYDGQQAVLVFRAVAGDTQVVDLFACGSEVALRSITLPAP